MSIALDVLINVILEDVVWSTARSGLDFAKPMVLLTVNGAFACWPTHEEEQNFADVDTTDTPSDVTPEEVAVLPSLLDRPEGGRPLTASAVISDVSESDSDTLSSAETDMDPEEQLLLLSTEHWPGAGGHHSPQLCPVCHIGLHSKGDLQFHLK